MNTPDILTYAEMAPMLVLPCVTGEIGRSAPGVARVTSPGRETYISAVLVWLDERDGRGDVNERRGEGLMTTTTHTDDPIGVITCYAHDIDANPPQHDFFYELVRHQRTRELRVLLTVETDVIGVSPAPLSEGSEADDWQDRPAITRDDAEVEWARVQPWVMINRVSAPDERMY